MKDRQDQPKRVDLESKIAFLERTIDDMHEMALVQGRALDQLQQRLDRLENALRSDKDGGEIEPHDTPPPHW